MRSCALGTDLKHGRASAMLMVTLLAAIVLAAILRAAPASGEGWCGENGVVRFSFAAGEEMVEIFDAGEPVNGVTTVDVTAWLTDVDEVADDGERFLRVGGFELELLIEGAEAFILKQEFPSKVLNVGRGNGLIVAGLVPGQRLTNGQAELVSWQVMFQGRPEDVRFGLKAGGTHTCQSTEGCPEAAPPMIYIGVQGSNQLNTIFGGGYVPAWLNPTGEPDRTPVHAKESYADIGIFKKRPARN